MNRSSSRNKENSQLQMNQFNLTGQNSHLLHKQGTLTNALGKMGSLAKEQIHQWIDDLDRPNESMTLSCLSQSPNLVRTRQVVAGGSQQQEESSSQHLMTGGIHSGMGDTLGRSEMEYTSEEINNKSGQVKSLSITGGTNKRYQQSSPSRQEDEESLLDEETKYEYNNTSGSRIRREIRNESDEDLEEDEDNVQELPSEDYCLSKGDTLQRSQDNSTGRDSPDFNRKQHDSSDLSCSHQQQNRHSQLIGNGASKLRQEVRDKQSRTFADSVHFQLKPNAEGKLLSQKEVVTTDDNGGQEESMEEDRSADEGLNHDDSSRLDSSDISGVDSFAQTQRSRISKFGYNRNGQMKVSSLSPHEGGRFFRGASSKSPYRSNILDKSKNRFEGVDHEESLDLTTSSQERKSQWGGMQGDVSQRSMIGKMTANNRTVNSDQTLNLGNDQSQFNRLHNNLHTMLQEKSYNQTTLIEGGGGKRNNRSIQRDCELEQALEQDSQQRMDSIDHKESNQNEMLKLRYQISQLEIEKGQLIGKIDFIEHQFKVKESELQEAETAKDDLNLKLLDAKDHLNFLRQKQSGQVALKDLRGKTLDQAKIEARNLQKELKKKTQELAEMEMKLHKNQNEDQWSYEVYNKAIRDKDNEIHKLKVFVQSLKRQENDSKQKQNGRQVVFEKEIKQLKIQHEQEIQAFQRRLQEEAQHMQSLACELNEMQQDGKVKDKNLKMMQKEIIKLTKQIEQQEKDKMKFHDELKGYKERCQELEREIEETRGSEFMFGNKQQKQNSADQEIKKMKEMFNQQLSKEKEAAKKWKSKFEDMELKWHRVKEELSTTTTKPDQSMSEKFQQDQELLNELVRTQEQLQQAILVEQKVRECFCIEEGESVDNKILEVQEQIELGKSLQVEYQKIQQQLIEAQNFQKQNYLQKQEQSQANSGQEMSKFRNNLLLQKEKQIEALSKQVSTLEENVQSSEAQLYSSQQVVCSLKEEIQSYQEQIQLLQNELDKVCENKLKAEQNVEELKDKLRDKVKEIGLLQGEKAKKLNQSVAEISQQEKKKWIDLCTMILEINLASDPLAEEGLGLQQSFADESEQALKHLQSQVRLVKKQEEEWRQKIETLEDEWKQKVQALEEEAESREIEYKEKLAQSAEIEKEVVQLKGKIQNLEREKDVSTLEMQQLQEFNDKVQKMLKDSESMCEKLKETNEEQKTDIRKLMRTQEHLFRGDKEKKPSQQNKDDDHTKVINEYEEQICELKKTIESLQQKQLPPKEPVVQETQAKNLYQTQFLEALDNLIENKTKQVTFNDLSLQLIHRIDRIKSQAMDSSQQSYMKRSERSKSSDMNKENRNFQANEGRVVTMGEVKGEEEELAWSIARFLKQSQGVSEVNGGKGSGINQMQLKNFFVNEDNTSLLQLSELITHNNQNQGQQPSPKESELQEILKQKEEEIKLLKEQLIAFNQQKPAFQDQCQQADFTSGPAVESLQSQLSSKQQDIFSLSQQLTELKEENSELTNTISSLKSSIKSMQNQKEQQLSQAEFQHQEQLLKVQSQVDELKTELISKAELLEKECEGLEKRKKEIKGEYESRANELEKWYQERIDKQEREFREKLYAMERDIVSGCEKDKEAVILNLQRQSDLQWEQKVSDIRSDYTCQIKSIKEEFSKEKEESKRVAAKEVKKLKEELERAKKQAEERAKKAEGEKEQELRAVEGEWREKVEAVRREGKKEGKAAGDKVRAEMRNQLDLVKNEMAKGKAEWEWEKKKMVQEGEWQMEKVRQDCEDQISKNAKQEKEKQSQLLKKKIEEKEKEFQRKIELIEADCQKAIETAKKEFASEKDRGIQIVKEEMRVEMRMQITKQVESEYSQQLANLKQKQEEELLRSKEYYEQRIREERASVLPTVQIFNDHKTQQRNVEIQCSLAQPSDSKELNDEINQSLDFMQGVGPIKNSIIGQSHPTNNNNESVYSQVTQSQQFIQQLQANFEEELDRQQQQFSDVLVQRQMEAVKAFEDVLVLEFDKILQSIYLKGKTAKVEGEQEKKRLVGEHERKRKEVNEVIESILGAWERKEGRQLRGSMETIKKKVSLVLQQFKLELENKFNVKKEEKKDESKPKTHKFFKDNNNHSEIMLSQENDQSSDFSQTSVMYSDVNSQKLPSRVPTPRQRSVTKQMMNLQNQSTENIKALISRQRSNQGSDIKKYVEVVSDDGRECSSSRGCSSSKQNVFNNNILRQIAPVPNGNGVMMVEVSKVVRDLKTLQVSIKQSKFYKSLMSVREWAPPQSEQGVNEQEERGAYEGELSVQSYRQLLNELYRMVVQLNNGIDQNEKMEEILKLKLTVCNLKQEQKKLQDMQSKDTIKGKVEQILSFFGNQQQNLSEECLKVFQKLESTHFQINKLTFQIQSLAENFIPLNDEAASSKKRFDIPKTHLRCSDFLSQNPSLFESPLLQSESSPDQLPARFCPEMLSPEEVCQLVTQVFQRLNSGQTQPTTTDFTLSCKELAAMNSTVAGANDPQQSFFQTFMSNEEYLKSAENFIRRFREHQKLNNTLRNQNYMNIPLQMNAAVVAEHNKTLSTALSQNQSRMQFSQYGSTHSCPQVGIIPLKNQKF